jgi:hypothetical protein
MLIGRRLILYQHSASAQSRWRWGGRVYLVEQVGIGLQRQRRIGMAQPAADLDDVDASSDQR